MTFAALSDITANKYFHHLLDASLQREAHIPQKRGEVVHVGKIHFPEVKQESLQKLQQKLSQNEQSIPVVKHPIIQEASEQEFDKPFIGTKKKKKRHSVVDAFFATEDSENATLDLPELPPKNPVLKKENHIQSQKPALIQMQEKFPAKEEEKHVDVEDVVSENIEDPLPQFDEKRVHQLQTQIMSMSTQLDALKTQISHAPQDVQAQQQQAIKEVEQIINGLKEELLSLHKKQGIKPSGAWMQLSDVPKRDSALETADIRELLVHLKHKLSELPIETADDAVAAKTLQDRIHHIEYVLEHAPKHFK